MKVGGNSPTKMTVLIYFFTFISDLSPPEKDSKGSDTCCRQIVLQLGFFGYFFFPYTHYSPSTWNSAATPGF